MADTGIFRELHAVVIPVPDLDAARAFYEGVLGLEVVRHVEGGLTVYRTNGPTHLCCFLPTGDDDGPSTVGAFPNFRSEDIDQTHAYLVDHDVDCGPIDAAPGIKWMRARDPFGNRFDVCEYGPEWLS
ncbi:MAG: VOC family protein [Planctomycetota bacterium]|nr:VOC family protein [Planctomycetota bacterium]